MNWTIAFDIYGTLIDHSAIQKMLTQMAVPNSQTFVQMWRSKQLEYSFRRGLMGAYEEFSRVTADALTFTCQPIRSL